MDLDEVMNRTKLTRDELEAAGFRTTPTMVRAMWPAWSRIAVPEWWRDSDERMGMLISDCPVGEAELIQLGLHVAGDEVMLPTHE